MKLKRNRKTTVEDLKLAEFLGYYFRENPYEEVSIHNVNVFDAFGNWKCFLWDLGDHLDELREEVAK